MYNDGSAGFGPGLITLIRDYAHNIEYIINRRLNNCTVKQINYLPEYVYPFSEFEVEIMTPNPLLNIAQVFPFAYEGATNIRGVDVDVWVGRQPPGSLMFPNADGVVEGSNGMFRVFFTRPGWRITGDRAVTNEPVLWRVELRADTVFTNATDNTTTSGNVLELYDIFDFSSEEPDFDVFDVSTCFSPSEYHVLSLAVPGHEQGLNFSQLRRNLRSAIVKYSNIKSLQVGNIQVSYRDTEGMLLRCRDEISEQLHGE